jgi:hypothetical protein
MRVVPGFLLAGGTGAMSKTKFALGLIVVAAFVAAALLLLNRGPADEVGVVRRLPDGSTLELRHIAFTTNYTYRYQGGNRLQRFIAPVVPPFLKKWLLPQWSGSMGWGNTDTNLFAITVNHSDAANWSSGLNRLVVFDDQGNSFDAAMGASTTAQPSEYVHGWQIRTFPRRSETLGLRFLAKTPDSSWTNAAEFRIRNPAFKNFPQWTPEPWPTTKRDGNLAVTLSEFQCGGRMSGNRGKGDEQTAARKTRIVFTFAGNGRPVDNWRVQKLTLSDATGNHWFPYLDFVKQDFDWTTNGTVEFFGALWSGENAWKLDVECVRTAGFSAEELWEAPPIQLPAFGQITDLTNNWQNDGVAVRLVALASPNTDHPGAFKWIAKWWGEDKNKVYSLALKLSPDLKSHRLSVVKAVDQDGREVEIVQHGNQDDVEQAVFLKPSPESRELKLTFAIQRSRFIQFLARPEFVKDNATNHPVKP